MSRIITCLAAVGLGTSVAAAQSPAASTLQRVDSMAAAEFAKDSIGSLTIGVVTPEGLVWTKTYGFADMTTHRLANRQSAYRIGSITKMFTGLMLQQLVAAGKIHLADPVERYYPEIKEIRGYSKLAAPISVQQLATMTSGISREPEEEGPFWSGPVATWDSTLRLALPHTNMDHAPGTKFLYSNIGYAILGATLGRAARVPFIQWERQHILEPLGMRHTAFEIEPAIAADVTRGYDIDSNGRVDPAQSVRESITGRGYKVPNGALYTTVDDLSQFLVLQLGHGPASVVAPARLDSAFDAVLGPDGKPTTQYGIGFGVERKGDHNFYGHNGGVAGFSALLEFDRDRQVGVIVLRNAAGGRANGPELGVRILQLLADTPR